MSLRDSTCVVAAAASPRLPVSGHIQTPVGLWPFVTPRRKRIGQNDLKIMETPGMDHDAPERGSRDKVHHSGESMMLARACLACLFAFIGMAAASPHARDERPLREAWLRWKERSVREFQLLRPAAIPRTAQSPAIARDVHRDISGVLSAGQRKPSARSPLRSLIDTAYITPWVGSREDRELFTYNREGKMTSRVSQHLWSDRMWRDGYRTVCTYTEDGREAAREYGYAGDPPRYRTSWVYDGGTTIETYEARNDSSGRLEVGCVQKTTIDAAGNTLEWSWEIWERGVPTFGDRVVNTFGGGHRMLSQRVFSLSGSVWHYQGGIRQTYDTSGRVTTEYAERLDSTGWSRYRDSTTYPVAGDSAITLHEDSVACGWKLTRRTAEVFDGFGRVVGRTIDVEQNGEWTTDEQMLSEESSDPFRLILRTERWTSGGWKNDTRRILGFHVSHGLTDELQQTWTGSEWANERSYHQSISQNGTVQALAETVWTDGSVAYCCGSRYLDGWEMVSYHSEEWEDGRLVRGDHWVWVDDPQGRPWIEEADLVSRGEWVHDDRVVRSYDRENRLQRADHFAWQPGGWVPATSSLASGRNSHLWFVDQCDNSIDFSWFVSVRFCYRQSPSAAINGPAGLPAVTELFANYPNPFNPSTQIRYDVPQIGQVRLSVFDLLGREVAVLVNDRKAPGSYSASFDATGLASGTYIYRLEAGGVTRSRRMLLVR